MEYKITTPFIKVWSEIAILTIHYRKTKIMVHRFYQLYNKTFYYNVTELLTYPWLHPSDSLDHERLIEPFYCFPSGWKSICQHVSFYKKKKCHDLNKILTRMNHVSLQWLGVFVHKNPDNYFHQRYSFEVSTVPDVSH